MRRLLVTIRYDGSVYHGYQVQSNALTVQEVFQNAVQKVFGKRLKAAAEQTAAFMQICIVYHLIQI